MPVMKRLEQAILATALVWEPLEHLHCVVSDDVDFDSFWMAPWDAGGTLGDGCRLCVTFWRTLATTSTEFRQMENIPHVIGAVKLECSTVWGFPQIDSAAVGCGAVELSDMYFRRTSFPPDKFSA